MADAAALKSAHKLNPRKGSAECRFESDLGHVPNYRLEERDLPSNKPLRAIPLPTADPDLAIVFFGRVLHSRIRRFPNLYASRRLLLVRTDR